MIRMRKSKFKKHIDQLEEDDLRDELLGLYDKLEEVRHYYQMELGSQEEREKRYVKARKEIEAKYKTKSFRKPRRPRIQKVKKILSELEKLSVFSYELIDIYLFDVETALNFVRKYDYFTQVLYNNISTSFEKACQQIHLNLMDEKYSERCENILVLSRYIPELHCNLKAISQDCSVNDKKNT